jgi:hypothetical protein
VGAFLQKLRALATLERWDDILAACERAYWDVDTRDLVQPPETALWRALALCRLGVPGLATAVYQRVTSRLRHRYRKQAKEIQTCTGS